MPSPFIDDDEENLQEQFPAHDVKEKFGLLPNRLNPHLVDDAQRSITPHWLNSSSSAWRSWILGVSMYGI